MILIKFGVLWTMYCSNVIITYYNISDTCLWIYNYFIENLVRKHLYCIWLKYPVRFDYNQWVFLIRSNFPYQILKHLYLNITCQEHALFLKHRHTHRQIRHRYVRLYLPYTCFMLFFLSFRRVDCSNNVWIPILFKNHLKKMFHSTSKSVQGLIIRSQKGMTKLLLNGFKSKKKGTFIVIKMVSD